MHFYLTSTWDLFRNGPPGVSSKLDHIDQKATIALLSKTGLMMRNKEKLLKGRLYLFFVCLFVFVLICVCLFVCLLVCLFVCLFVC